MTGHKLDLNVQIVSSFQGEGDEREQPTLLFFLSMMDPWLPVHFTRCSVWAYYFHVVFVSVELTILHCYASTKLYSKFCRDGSNIFTFIYKYHK